MDFQTEWITVPQALKLLRITSRTTLYKYAFKYKIRVSKPLGRLYYNLPDIVSIIEKNAVRMGV